MNTKLNHQIQEAGFILPSMYYNYYNIPLIHTSQPVLFCTHEMQVSFRDAYNAELMN